MKTWVIIITVIGLALIACFLLAVIVVAMNEEPGPRCGTCMNFDRDLRICWKRNGLPSRQEYDKKCEDFQEKD